MKGRIAPDRLFGRSELGQANAPTAVCLNRYLDERPHADCNEHRGRNCGDTPPEMSLRCTKFEKDHALYETMHKVERIGKVPDHAIGPILLGPGEDDGDRERERHVGEPE